MNKEWRNHQVVVVGAGRSGLALARLLVEQGARVTLSDRRRREEIEGLEQLAELPVSYNLGGHDQRLFVQADLIAVSPGVALDSEPLRQARSLGIPVLGEIEIAARQLSAQIIAITGTNGKSTTTSLLGEILLAWGKQVFVGGNLGDPLAGACTRDFDWAVLELSSFQLETVDRFHPAIGVLLNLSPDHLDRYPDLASYYQAKMNLFNRMTAVDSAVLNADDPEVVRRSDPVRARKIWFSSSGQKIKGLRRQDGRLIWNLGEEETSVALADLPLPGEHNVENAMAALIPALLLGCPLPLAWRAVCGFAGLEHRLQLVRRLAGVDWYNDSKATNVGSVLKSLSGFATGQVVLIAGGKDKRGDLAPLRPLLQAKVAQLILLGEAAPRMAAELAGCCPLEQVSDLAAAVDRAHRLANRGSVVLLSPACSSFDMFTDFAARGEAYARLVRALPETEEVV